ncbi:MAG: HAD family hydrolase [Clostridiales bacterium]|nr:HAD family hydrolase [Clostridiales bacterium]
MIKQLIFDLDNTLLDWSNTYYSFCVKKICENYNLKDNYDEILDIVIKCVDSYESKYDYFTVENFVKELNLCGNIIFTNEMVEKLLNYFGCCIPDKIDSKIIETLDYLKSKYELVVLTNWFENYQIKRLEKTGLLKYFTNVYGTEKIKMKPNKEAFEAASGNYNLNECVMIGDNLKNDIMGALNVGMGAIFYNRKKNIVDSNVICINKFEDLIELL